MTVVSRPAPAVRASAAPFRVMVVDDSAVIRGLVGRWLGADPAVQLVASCPNGKVAVNEAQRIKPEVVVLDIEMPEMDGLTALPKLIAAVPGLKVIMASTLTLRNADVSMRALAAGAADYIPKPSSTAAMTGADVYKRELIEKVKALGAAFRAATGGRGEGPAPLMARRPLPAMPRAPIVLRKLTPRRRQVLAVGSSTGGPQALFGLFAELKGKLDVPVLITQHMPKTFTTILAEHLRRIVGGNCDEAKDGEVLKNGRIYIAPGDQHLTVAQQGAERVVRLTQEPPENFCRPAVDPMFRSLASVFGQSALAVVLTGMGADGLKGGKLLAAADGALIAQDEASSVVWGMPGAVATAGVCNAVVPLKEIGATILKLLQGAAT
jgi:two-component system, chemotaxis family, protein-glutamate methylesterase/glutaminase